MNDSNIILYQQFLNNLISVELNEPYIILNESIIPNIKNYMKILLCTPFTEDSYHTFYGNVKNIIGSFFLYWSQAMDENIKTANRCENSSDRTNIRERVINLMNKTINTRRKLENDFVKDFIEINSQFDVKYIKDEFQAHIIKIQELITQLENFDYQELQKLLTTTLSLSVTKEYKIFDFASNQLATVLTDNHKKLVISLEENFKRVLRNLQSPTELLSPGKRSFTLSAAACCKSLKDVITNDFPMQQRVTEELQHWHRKLHEFLHIENNLDKLEKVKNKLIEQEQSPQSSNENAMLEIRQKMEEVKKLGNDVSKSILTFFCVEGANRLFHSGDSGSSFMDEYGHQVYLLNYDLKRYHTCGDYFVEIHDDARPYYDENGRYIMKYNKKCYKAAPCCSSYKLDDWGIFVKEPDSEFNIQCKEEIKKSYYDTVRAQEKEFAKIKGKLTKKSAIYLWNSLGDVLAKSLLDVAKRQPENPIHYLAHTLLYYKYHKKSKNHSADLEERLVPKTEAVFKKTKTPQAEELKTNVLDEDREIYAINANIAQQLLFNLCEQY